MYDTRDYARSRLDGTVIRWNDIPIYVLDILSVKRQLYVLGTVIENDEEVTVPLIECNLKPVPLGYVNFQDDAYYTMRMPMRNDWRQGLRHVSLIDIDGRQFNGMGYKLFVKTIQGKYPSFLEATTDSQFIRHRAFHRDFAVNNNGKIIYKGQMAVASVDRNTMGIVIEKEWVREALDDAIGA